MQLSRRISVLLGCFLVLVAHAGVNDAFVHRLNLNKGDTYEFETFELVETPKVRYRMHSKNFLTVVEVQSDEYVLETVNKDLVFAIEGTKGTYLPSSTTTVRQRKDGTVLDIKCDTAGDAGSFVKNPNNFRYPDTPIGLGGSWNKFVMADAALGTPDITIRYVVSGRKLWNGFDVLIVDFTSDPAVETPMPMKGTTYIDAESGLSVFTEGYLENRTKVEPLRSHFRMQIKP